MAPVYHARGEEFSTGTLGIFTPALTKESALLCIPHRLPVELSNFPVDSLFQPPHRRTFRLGSRWRRRGYRQLRQRTVHEFPDFFPVINVRGLALESPPARLLALGAILPTGSNRLNHRWTMFTGAARRLITLLTTPTKQWSYTDGPVSSEYSEHGEHILPMDIPKRARIQDVRVLQTRHTGVRAPLPTGIGQAVGSPKP